MIRSHAVSILLVSVFVTACASGAARVDPSAAEAERLPPPDSTEEGAAEPAIRDLVVSVRPSRVAPGTEPEIVVAYTLEDVPADGLEVLEQREVTHDGASVVSLELRPTRGPGRVTSSQGVLVPVDAPSGVYNVEVTVTVAGTTARGNALFEIR